MSVKRHFYQQNSSEVLALKDFFLFLHFFSENEYLESEKKIKK